MGIKYHYIDRTFLLLSKEFFWRSDMPVLIKFIKLTSDEVIIEPIRDENLHQTLLAPPSDLSLELEELKEQLNPTKTWLRGYDRSQKKLIENRDYVRVKEHYQLRFQGKSSVLRALYSIPMEFIKFDGSTLSEFQTEFNFTKKCFEMMRLKFAATISDRECTVFDEKLVKEAHQFLFTRLVEELEKVHRSFNQPSQVIDQLKRDMEKCKETGNDYPFTMAPFFMLLASIYEAALFEKAHPTTPKTGMISFLGGNSLLFMLYESLLKSFAEFVSDEWSREMRIIESKESKLCEYYDLCVAPFQKPKPIYWK